MWPNLNYLFYYNAQECVCIRSTSYWVNKIFIFGWRNNYIATCYLLMLISSQLVESAHELCKEAMQVPSNRTVFYVRLSWNLQHWNVPYFQALLFLTWNNVAKCEWQRNWSRAKLRPVTYFSSFCVHITFTYFVSSSRNL